MLIRRAVCAALAALAILTFSAVAARADDAPATPASPAMSAGSVGLTLSAPPATEPAGSPKPGEPGGPPAQPVYWTASPYGSWQYTSRYGEADFHVTRVGIGLEAIVPLSPSTVVSANLKVEDSVYDWNDFEHEHAGIKTPISDALLLRFGPGVEWTINPQWTLDGGLLIQTAGDTSALGNDATTYGALITAKYKVSPTLEIGAGLIAYSELKDDSGVLPLGSVTWKITPQWEFSIEDTEIKLAYQYDKQTSIFLAGVYEFRQYRLEDSGPLKNGSLTDRSIPVRVGVNYAATPSLDLLGEVGVIAYQELTIDDRNDNRVTKDQVDPTVFLGLRAEYRF